MTEFIYGIALACPTALINEANDLMAWIGYSYGDHDTFFVKVDENDAPDPYTDENGNPYALASGRFKKDMLDRLTADLTRYPIPDWCYDVDGLLLIDTAGAQTAQSALALIPDDSQIDPAKLVSNAGAAYIYVQVQGALNEPGVNATNMGPFPAGGAQFWLAGFNDNLWVGIDWNMDGTVDVWLPLNTSARTVSNETKAVLKEARKKLE